MALYTRPMPKALVLTHVPEEGPARVARAFTNAGFEMDVLELRSRSDVPSTLDEWDALIVMGGPMGVADAEDPQYAFLSREIDLLRQAVAADFPTLAICLGSQLLAAAAGARVYPLEVGDPPRGVREVGWGAVHFVRTEAEEPVLAGLDEAEIMLHWHGDTFDLPPLAVRLASTLVCENQMYRLGRRQYGVQFHPEVDASDIQTWLAKDGDYVRGALGPHGSERIERDTIRYMPRLQDRGNRLLENLARALTRPAVRC